MRTSVPNPWLALPKAQPYVLPEDASAIDHFNNRAAPKNRYDLNLFPEPFFGLPSAPVILLALNPGCSEDDVTVHADPAFRRLARLSIKHKLGRHPFLHLQPGSSTRGAEWWRRIAKVPIDALANEGVIARNICCVQYFPYHSTAFSSAALRVPSQQYSFEIVRRAMRRNAEVVVMRAWRLWSAAIPELTNYKKVYRLKNPRNPTLSPRNLKRFDAVLERIRAGA